MLSATRAVGGGLFPLDRGRGFGGDVVNDAVDAADFADDLVGDVAEKVVGEGEPVSRHGVGRDDGAQSYGVLVGAFVAHHAAAMPGLDL